MNEDDICYLLNVIAEMIDGKEEEDLHVVWNYLTYKLSEMDKVKQ